MDPPHQYYLIQNDKSYIKLETMLQENQNDALLNKENELIAIDVKTEDLRACHVCLSSEGLRAAGGAWAWFARAAGVACREDAALCPLCAAVLARCVALRDAARHADALLTRHKQQLNPETLRDANRKDLTVYNLSTKHFPIDHYDILIDGPDETLPDVHSELIINPADSVKPEEEDFKYECDDFDIQDSDSDFEKPLINEKIKVEKSRAEKVVKKVVRKKTSVKEKKTTKKVKNKTEITVKRNSLKNDKVMEEFFNIKVLSLDEQIEEFAKRKLSKNYINAEYKCEMCLTGFVHDKAFNIHMEKHTEKMGDLSCDICKRRCANKGILRNHLEYHKYKFSCKKCDYEAMAKNSAKLHIDWHNGKQYNCDKCGKIFARISSLLSHVRIKHPSDHVCGLCGYSYLSEKGIYAHKKLKHRLEDLNIPEDGPLCSECNVRFASVEALTTHLRVSSKHGADQRNEERPKNHKSGPGSGNGKGKTRGRKLALRVPKNRKDQNREKGRLLNEPVGCEQCGEQMYSTSEYRDHFEKAHPDCKRKLFPQWSKPSLCDTCGKIFKTPANLQDHIMSTHAETPVLYKCETCGKGFKKKSTLSLHKNVHLGRRYPCPICGKMFNQVSNRDRHYTYVHSTVKDVKCDYCEKYFKSDEEKKLHTTYVHFKKPYPKRSSGKRDRSLDMGLVKRRRFDVYMQDSD